MSFVNEKAENFTEVYNNYYPLVYSIVYSKTSSSDDSHDICQEIFIRFFEKYEEVKEAKKWILGTMKFVIMEYFRAKEKNDVDDIDSIFEDINLQFVNGHRDSRIMIQEAIENMNNFDNEQEKLVFDLIAIHNYTYQEAGKNIGLTERQCRYKYSVVVKKIKDYFEKKGIKNLEDLL